MTAFDELIANAASRFGRENLTSFMESFSSELAQSGEISLKDKEFVTEFEKVHTALVRVEEKTRQLEVCADNAESSDVKDAKERLYDLHCSLDRLQTAALRNPSLQSFAKKVARHAREKSEKLETLTKEGPDAELDELYEQFKNLNQ